MGGTFGAYFEQLNAKIKYTIQENCEYSDGIVSSIGTMDCCPKFGDAVKINGSDEKLIFAYYNPIDKLVVTQDEQGQVILFPYHSIVSIKILG